MKFFVPFSVKTDPFFRACAVLTPVASMQLPFHGRDLIFTPSNIFFYSKSGVSQFTQLLIKLSTSAIAGSFVEIVLVGLGFRLIKLGSFLLLKLGYSHYVKLAIPASIYIVGYKKRLIVFGAYTADVNQFVEKIVQFRKPDVYKNKGIQVVGRTFRLKIGKQK